MISRFIVGTTFAVVLWFLPHVAGAERLESLEVLQKNYPRVFFFRDPEWYLATGKDVPYEQWQKTFERLMGIEGHVLYSWQFDGQSPRKIDFFTRFKHRHPDQLVLLHFLGDCRGPQYYKHGRFFAGHWLYFNGAKILSDVPAELGETDIRVENPGLFKVNMGRFRSSNEDIGLCTLDTSGKPNWHQSEQVQLVSIDHKKGIIRVRRGCYGTKPRVFPAGQAYSAAHATYGPGGNKNNKLLWYYNYSTRSPQDAEGRRCADVLAEYLGEQFGPDGALAAFDGLEFDVMWHETPGGRSQARGADCDADGRIDYGLFGGVNSYGIGVVKFCRKLREELGDDRIIQADGMDVRNQRAFGILNGMESEGWPHLRDWEIRDWSGGLNRHLFWDQNARPPVFNYINHRFALDQPGVRNPEIPFHIHRLVFAAAIFTNAAIGQYGCRPENDPDGLLGIWDEFRAGTEDRLGWLDKPLGPAVRVATRQPGLLEAKGKPVGLDLLKRFSGTGAHFAVEDDAVKVTTADPKASEICFRLCDVPCGGPDLFVRLTARGLSMRGYPPEMARMMWVGVAPGKSERMITKPFRPLGWRKPKENSHFSFMTWVNEKDFASGFYFPEVKSPTVSVEFVIEGGEPVWISKLSVHAHPDAIYREFEHGLVLANPSPRPYGFDLDQLVPGRKFRRLKATANQDTKTNDGSPVTGRLTLQPHDGLFLIKDRGGEAQSRQAE